MQEVKLKIYAYKGVSNLGTISLYAPVGDDMLLFAEYVTLSFCGDMLFWLIAYSPTIYVGLYLKRQMKYTIKRRGVKNIKKQSSTNKIKFIYQEIYEKSNITNILI